MTDIPQQAKDAIDFVIENDEGGWKLTHNPNDPDGGWTYAGVTAKTWNEYSLKKSGITWTELAIKTEPQERLQEYVYEIYYTQYYMPLAAFWSGDSHDDQLAHDFLSCAVNCGVETAKQIGLSGGQNGREFLHNWLLHYAELVRKNAEAWRDYAKFLKSQIELGEKTTLTKVEEPKTLRAEFLAGWINRVEKYR